MRKLFLPILTAAVIAAAALSQIVPSKSVAVPAPSVSQVVQTPITDQLVQRVAADPAPVVPVAIPVASNPQSLSGQAILAVLVPLVVAAIKTWAPHNKSLTPLLAIALGGICGALDNATGIFGGTPWLTAATGLAGIGLRQVYKGVADVLVGEEPPRSSAD